MKKIIFACVCIMLAVFNTGCSKESGNSNPPDAATGTLSDHNEGKPRGADEEKGYLPLYTMSDLEKLSEQTRNGKTIQSQFTNEYKMVDLDHWNIKSPQGIICRENDIIIADKEENCLLIKDYEGNILKTIGKSGNGKVEFLSPTALALENGKIYICDIGNSRIQILTEEFAYVDEIPIEYGNLIDYGANIAVDKNENIYLTVLSGSIAFVICYEKGSKEAIELGRNFVGTLTASEGTVYAANVGSVYISGESAGYGTGYTSLYQVEPGGMTKICSLPNCFNPAAILIQDNKLIGLSNFYARLDIFNLKGEYQESICEVSPPMTEAYMSMASDGSYFISGRFPNKLIQVKRS